MMDWKMRAILAAGLLAAVPLTAQAAFVAVEQFEGLSLGAINGQNGWAASLATTAVVVDPADASNQVLAHPDDNGWARKGVLVPQGSTATLFYRMRFSATGTNSNVGLSDVAAATEFIHFETQVNTANDQGTTPTRWNVRDAGSFDQFGTYAAGVWYNVWQVIDASSDTYDVLVGGGTFGAQTNVIDDDNQSIFGFRNGVAANDLVNFFMRSGGSNNGTWYIDDVFLDAGGANLSNPLATAVPEPAGTLLLAAAGLVIARRRR